MSVLVQEHGRRPPLYDALAPVYDRWLSGDEAAQDCARFYLSRLDGQSEPVLELGCGTGRICRALAAAGVPTIGLDESMRMLGQARAAGSGAEPATGLVRGRFQQLPFRGDAFAAVILPMRTIGHVTEPALVAALFSEVRRVLRPGGRFLLDHYNLDPDWARAHDGTSRLMFSGMAAPAEDRAVLIWDRYDYDFDARMLRCTVQVDEVGPGGSAPASSTVDFRFRWFEPEEIISAGRDAGLELQGCWGDFEGAPFQPTSEHMVFSFTRPKAMP